MNVKRGPCKNTAYTYGIILVRLLLVMVSLVSSNFKLNKKGGVLVIVLLNFSYTCTCSMSIFTTFSL